MRRQTDRLLLFGILAVAIVYILVAGERVRMPVDAEVAQQTLAVGQVMVVPVQIDRDNYGIVMVDTELRNLWVYKLDSRSSNRLKLIAARNWKYDRLLEEFNTAEPTPKQVEELLERLSGSGEQTQGSKQSRLEKQYEELLDAGVSEEKESGRDK